MRKFSKLLALILSLVLIVAAFTVVTLAADEEENPVPHGFSSSTPSFADGTFSNKTPGTLLQEATYNNLPKTGV